MPEHSTPQQPSNTQDDKLETLLASIFGPSDSDSDHEDPPIPAIMHTEGEVRDENWKMIKEVPGLWLCRSFLSDLQQEYLLSAINSEEWFADGAHNQAMRFGDLPGWALELSCMIHTAICSHSSCSGSRYRSDPSINNFNSDTPLPHDMLWREPLFDQMIVNCYQPGEGICAHVDLLKFEDGIAIVSLESSCVMHFNRAANACQEKGKKIELENCSKDVEVPHEQSSSQHLKSSSCRPTNGVVKDKEISCIKIPILLMPGDLILMSGEARYNWTHEIDRKECSQVWNGEKINQGRRVSVTLRRLVEVA